MTAARALLLARCATLVIVGVVMQVGPMSALSTFGVRPELGLLLVGAAGVAGGADLASRAGFALGLGYDLFLQSPLGLCALVYTVVGYAVGSMQPNLASEGPLLRALFGAGATAAGLLSWLVAGRLFDSAFVGSGVPVRVVIVASTVNAVLAVPAVRLWRWAIAPEAVPRVAR